ncbi:hypothetical protein M432DRAFT_152766 [Thermoascus aurantiacus ATCC 26904]
MGIQEDPRQPCCECQCHDRDRRGANEADCTACLCCEPRFRTEQGAPIKQQERIEEFDDSVGAVTFGVVRFRAVELVERDGCNKHDFNDTCQLNGPKQHNDIEQPATPINVTSNVATPSGLAIPSSVVAPINITIQSSIAIPSNLTPQSSVTKSSSMTAPSSLISSSITATSGLAAQSSVTTSSSLTVPGSGTSLSLTASSNPTTPADLIIPSSLAAFSSLSQNHLVTLPPKPEITTALPSGSAPRWQGLGFPGFGGFELPMNLQIIIWSRDIARAYAIKYGHRSRPGPDAERGQQRVFWVDGSKSASNAGAGVVYRDDEMSELWNAHAIHLHQCQAESRCQPRVGSGDAELIAISAALDLAMKKSTYQKQIVIFTDSQESLTTIRDCRHRSLYPWSLTRCHENPHESRNPRAARCSCFSALGARPRRCSGQRDGRQGCEIRRPERQQRYPEPVWDGPIDIRFCHR